MKLEVGALRIFCSYSRKDEEHLNDLRDSLRGLERQGLIQWWHDREITPGWEWEEAIDRHIKTADVVVLLVSRAFMASDYVYEHEISKAVERHELGEARVIPIILRPADWEWASFGKLQALPKDAKPITRWPDPDDAWLDVAKGVRRAVGELLRERHEQAAKEQYHKALEEAWADKKLSDAAAEQLGTLAIELGLNTDTTADIEREVIGDTKEEILERQKQAAREKERKERVDELYARARRLHKNQQWQSVADTFEQIRAEDPAYVDREGLLSSARKALEEAQELARRAAATYAEGQRHMDAGEWPQALLSFEQVQQLQPGYRETEALLSQTREKLEEQEKANQYREALKSAWADRELHSGEVESLMELANNKLRLSPKARVDIEREVLGESIKVILERQEQAAREKERSEWLEQLYAEARRSYQDRQWQRVVDVFEQIHAEESGYPDPEGLQASAREALDAQELLEERIATLYGQGEQFMRAREWQQALECFEEVQRLDPGYRAVEWRLSQARRLYQVSQELARRQPALWQTLRSNVDRIWCTRTLKGRSKHVNGVAFSPDGRLLASGSGGDWSGVGESDNSVRLWGVDTGELLRTLEGHEDWVSSVAFSPDGVLLASGSDDYTVRLWSVENGESVRTLEGHSGAVKGVAFSPDGVLMASGSNDKTVRLWGMENGESVRTLQHTNAVKGVAFSPDGVLMASGSNDKTVWLWGVDTGELLRTLEGHEDWVSSVAFSPDGVLLASGSDDYTVRLWSVENGESVRTLERHTNPVSSVAFSPDGVLMASGSNDKTVRLWGMENGESVRTLEGHSGAVKGVAFSPDGVLMASGSYDNTVRLWGVR